MYVVYIIFLVFQPFHIGVIKNDKNLRIISFSSLNNSFISTFKLFDERLRLQFYDLFVPSKLFNLFHISSLLFLF